MILYTASQIFSIDIFMRPDSFPAHGADHTASGAVIVARKGSTQRSDQRAVTCHVVTAAANEVV